MDLWINFAEVIGLMAVAGVLEHQLVKAHRKLEAYRQAVAALRVLRIPKTEWTPEYQRGFLDYRDAVITKLLAAEDVR